MAPTVLPQFVVLYSEGVGKYMSYVSDNDDGELNHILAVRGSHVSDTRSMFETEQSLALPTMYHIRSIHHNRYLRRRSEEELWIVAASEKPNDDINHWSSTLFEASVAAGKPGSAQLLHGQSGRYLQWYNDSTSPYSMCIWAQSTDPAEPKARFQVFDSRRQIVLPKYVAFKGIDGAFLGVGISPNPPVKGALQFVFESYRDESVPNEIVPLPEPDGRDGVVRIKNVSNGAFWRVDTSTEEFHTVADVYSTTGDATISRDTMFQALWVNDHTIGLRNLANRSICFRDSVGVLEGLRAVADEVDDPSRLLLTELVMSRRIVDIKFLLNDGRVYNERANRVLNPGVDVSNETEEPQTFKIDIPYGDVKTSTWRAITSNFKVGPVVELEPDKIPHISDSEAIEIVSPFQPSYVWGETVSKEFKEVSIHEVTLPAMTTASVMLLATEATCDVPLTYTRHDVLDETTGKEDIHVMEDGLYTGTNYINLWVIVSTPQPIANKNDD